jgi:hypothetical protein
MEFTELTKDVFLLGDRLVIAPNPPPFGICPKIFC